MIENLTALLSETAYIPHIVKDYLNKSRKLEAFAHNPDILQNPTEHLRFQSGFKTGNRELLLKVSTSQISALDLKVDTTLVKEHITKLGNENCYTVTTGQQIHPFGGPLLVFHKIADTINLAKAWQLQHPEFDFVPVLWLATDDHDFEEVANFKIGHDEHKWETENAGKYPVGRLGCGNLPAIAAEAIAKSEAFDYKQWLGIFEKLYSSYPTFAMAMQAFYTEFFAEYGLLVLNPDDERLKQEFVQATLRDINTGINEIKVNETIAVLQDDYKIQLKPRRINSFIIINNERLRPELEGDAITMDEGRVRQTREQLEKFILENPSCISPNAVLRPMYQETILPNIVYVGGPNELAYWLELKSAFESNGIHFPLLALRNIRIYLPMRIAERIGSMGLDPLDFLMPVSEIIQKYYQVNNTEFYENAAGLAKLKELWDDMAAYGITVDKSLVKFFEAEKHKAVEQWTKAEQKIVKSQKNSFDSDIQWLENSYSKYFDPKNLAERKTGIFQLPFEIGTFRSRIIEKNGSEKLSSIEFFFL